MASNPPDNYVGAGDDFLEQMLSIPSYSGLTGAESGNSSETAPLNVSVSHQLPMFPLGLSLDNGRDGVGDMASGFGAVKTDREAVNNNMGNFYQSFDPLHGHAVRHPGSQVPQAFQGHQAPNPMPTVPHQPSIRPRVRARRGQATDPHSIAERLRRERISERIKALQELVPSCNKTDRAAMLDEILDYVKFLRLQVKVLSMSRLGGAGAVAQLVADIPTDSIEGENSEVGTNNNTAHVWGNWSNEETEREVAKLMEEDVGAAMQFLQSKSLCIMPVSLAALIYPNNQFDESTVVKPEPSAPSSV